MIVVYLMIGSIRLQSPCIVVVLTIYCITMRKSYVLVTLFPATSSSACLHAYPVYPQFATW